MTPSTAAVVSGLMPVPILMPLAAAAGEASMDRLTSGSGGQSLGAGYLIQFSLGLLVVLLGVLALAWLLKRVGRLQGGNGALMALGGLSLGPRERVVLVQVGREQLLIGVAPGQVQALHVLDQPVETGPLERESGGKQSPFRDRLLGALQIAHTNRGSRYDGVAPSGREAEK